jgi:hypothetical protein
MYYLPFFQELQSYQKLLCISTYFFFLKPFEIVLFQILKQIIMEQFKEETLMLSEPRMFQHAHDIVLVVGVL